MESNGCVLFYKGQGVDSIKYKELKKDDFVLIIMNSGQEEVLKKYSSDCVCLDATHGLNQYDFDLHTLLVLDDVREGFPCAFLISNKSDETVLKIFFNCIRERIGFQISCKVFMSDMAEAYYNAWKLVMKPAQFRFVKLLNTYQIMHIYLYIFLDYFAVGIFKEVGETTCQKSKTRKNR